jgi:mannose-1-phosphate guanylyltransferase
VQPPRKLVCESWKVAAHAPVETQDGPIGGARSNRDTLFEARLVRILFPGSVGHIRRAAGSEQETQPTMLYAIIMAGGSGTRFWPKSRRNRPKQLLRLSGETTMLQQTVERIEPLVERDRILIITGSDQAEATRAQLPGLPEGNVIAEPAPRDTAPCVGLAAGIVDKRDPTATMIVMPADHVIEPAEAFRATVKAAVAVVDLDPDALVTFGIKPTHPETGYGYIEEGALVDTRDGIAVHEVVQFREKPDRETAERFLTAGNFVWNSGIFVWRARTILAELAALEPILKDWNTPKGRETFKRLFPELERVPIDKAVMERASKVRVLDVPYRWNDVGDWRALGSLLDRDAAGNAIQGHVIARDTTNSIIISDDGGLVATLGVDDLVIVHSGRATLVARRDRLDQLKALVERLSDEGHASYL